MYIRRKGEEEEERRVRLGRRRKGEEGRGEQKRL
tara:strand:- start:413 stop:514 length:102 start_codon:yes stop_codon:yes gene_type:complete